MKFANQLKSAMGILRFDYVRVPVAEKYGEGDLNSLAKEDFEDFNLGILGLGDLAKKGRYVQALAAVFDLKGFTPFFNQPDPHLVVPDYLREFLTWIFDEIRGKFKEGETNDRVTIWGSLPFFAKFMGDGILFLWDTQYSGGMTGIGNIIFYLRKICANYSESFFPNVSKKYSKTPDTLRVGIARGQIISVGNGEDFVGPCINIASRLQKLSLLPFAVSARGCAIDKCFPKKQNKLVIKKTDIRGIGPEELVIVFKEDFEKLPPDEKAKFY